MYNITNLSNNNLAFEFNRKCLNVAYVLLESCPPACPLKVDKFCCRSRLEGSWVFLKFVQKLNDLFQIVIYSPLVSAFSGCLTNVDNMLN